MIRLSCTNCREVLSIDDAFAGGVCRCQHCGTIQTVPAATAANEVVVGGPNLGGGRASTNGSTFGGPHEGTGLDDLAGAVASSGLSSHRLRRPGPNAGSSVTAPAIAPPRQNLIPLFAVAGGVIVLLMVAVVFLALRPASPANPTPGPTTPTAVPHSDGPTPPPAATAGPAFCGTPLTGDTVVYLLDRGTATQEVFAALKDATLKSITSLGSGRHFAVVFWDNGSGDAAAYPKGDTAYATQDNVDAARRAMDDVSAFGQTDVKPALALALAQHPDTIVMATAKGWSLDDAWVKDVTAARGASPAKIDTFSLGANPAPDDHAVPPLKAVAEQTGGTYVELSNSDLKTASE